MTNYRDNFLIVGAVMLSILSFAISIYLTSRFTSELGEKIGLAGLFFLIGVALDLTKHLSPLLILNHLKERQIGIAAMIACFFVVLTFVSIFASADALTTSLNTNESITISEIKENTEIAAQISILKETKGTLVNLLQTQKKHGQITAMKSTTSRISKIDEQLIQLLNKATADKKQRVEAAKKSLYAQAFTPTAIYSFAAVIELISVIMSVSAYSLSQKVTSSLNESTIDDKKLQEMIVHLSQPQSDHSNNGESDTVTNNGVLYRDEILSGDDFEIKSVLNQHETQSDEAQRFGTRSNQSLKSDCLAFGDDLMLKCQHNDTKVGDSLVEEPLFKKNTPIARIDENGHLVESSISEIKEAIRNKEIEPKFRSIDSLFSCSRTIKNLVFEELVTDGVLIRIKGKKSLSYSE